MRSKLSLIAALLLTSCGPLVKIGDSGPQPQRFTLALLPQEAQRRALPIMRVDDLEAPAELATQRMAVRVGAQEVRYLRGGVWTDRPARLLRALVAEALRQRSTASVLSPGQINIRADYNVSGRLIAFQAEADGAVANRVRVALDLTLQKGSRIETHVFDIREHAASDAPADLAAATNRAANHVTAQAADWLLSRMSDSSAF